MEKEESFTESNKGFANDTEIQIIDLLQTKEGREILKQAINLIKNEGKCRHA